MGLKLTASDDPNKPEAQRFEATAQQLGAACCVRDQGKLTSGRPQCVLGHLA